MAARPIPRLTEQEYLALEDASPGRHEYFRGAMYAMSGGSSNHSKIQVALTAEAYSRLQGRDCTTYNSDMRVRAGESGLYTYPDLSIVCGKPQFLPPNDTTLLNPIVIVEVLSPSTEGYDRGAKFHRYKMIESLRHYVLVSSTEMSVDVVTLSPAGHWEIRSYSAPEESITLDAIDLTVPLSEIYAKVTFEIPEHL